MPALSRMASLKCPCLRSASALQSPYLKQEGRQMADQRPNILFIFTDQQRADTIHAGGNPIIRTPNLDRLCREGVRFSSAFTPSPECVPARCSLIYGRYPHQTGCFSNANPMPDDSNTLMAALSAAGYRTHAVGKMHLRRSRRLCAVCRAVRSGKSAAPGSS